MKHQKLIALVALMIILFTFSGIYWTQISIQHQQAIPLAEIMANPASYVNKTVTVEGILESMPLSSPTPYGLYNGTQSIEVLYVNWTSNVTLIPQYNAISTIIQGIIREEEWIVPNAPSENFTINVYYSEAEKVELLT